MNFSRLRNLLRKKNYVADRTVHIHWTARIINNLGDKQAIRIGPCSVIKGELLTFGHGGKIVLGSYCFVGEETRLWSAAEIIVGDRVLIGHQVNIFDNLTHPISARERHLQFRQISTVGQPRSIDLSEQPVYVGDDAWIGAGATILAGITIGEGAIIGAGSVVTSDVAAWTIIAGNPARLIRTIPESER
jgi:acetyltransferase-like isoleucine patch superfamily enzyme